MYDYDISCDLEEDQSVWGLKLPLGPYSTESSAAAVGAWVSLQPNEEKQTEGAGRTVTWGVQLTEETPLSAAGGEA